MSKLNNVFEITPDDFDSVKDIIYESKLIDNLYNAKSKCVAQIPVFEIFLSLISCDSLIHMVHKQTTRFHIFSYISSHSRYIEVFQK